MTGHLDSGTRLDPKKGLNSGDGDGVRGALFLQALKSSEASNSEHRKQLFLHFNTDLIGIVTKAEELYIYVGNNVLIHKINIIFLSKVGVFFSEERKERKVRLLCSSFFISKKRRNNRFSNVLRSFTLATKH
ncbi:uncharacterized protein LOC143174344 isoform X1 [Nomia melanderi]|uniref:uncharacterized protein LOC143174344 isoform X1 n=1 Tax=Nomia melanderi TaxID=2448451 RepID=UPI003FCD97EB